MADMQTTSGKRHLNSVWWLMTEP